MRQMQQRARRRSAPNFAAAVGTTAAAAARAAAAEAAATTTAQKTCSCGSHAAAAAHFANAGGLGHRSAASPAGLWRALAADGARGSRRVCGCVGACAPLKLACWSYGRRFGVESSAHRRERSNNQSSMAARLVRRSTANSNSAVALELAGGPSSHHQIAPVAVGS